MDFLPTSSGSRPRLACEILTGGVVAARSPEPGLPLAGVARVEVAPGAVTPGLKPGNIVDRLALIAAIRRALEGAGARAHARNADLTLIIPDGAVRVLLLDFDSLPTKLSDALPIIRFRLKKLVPFDTDDAMVTYQVMSTSRSMIRVLAAAMPRDVLREYESAVREAGFEPGAVLPSTLAALAAVDEGEAAALVVNAHEAGVTTAIVRSGIVLLHRSVEMTELPAPAPAGLPPALFESAGDGLLPLVDRDATEAEWAAQQPLPEFGRNPYTDRFLTEEPTQNEDGITGMPASPLVLNKQRYSEPDEASISARGIDMYAEGAASVSRSPYASALLQQQLEAQLHNAPYTVPSAAEEFGPLAQRDRLDAVPALPLAREVPVHTLAQDVQAEEIARAISVAMAFYEDTLSAVPDVLLSAGPLGAEAVSRLLQEQGLTGATELRVREVVEPASLAVSASTATVPRGWLAGVMGALKS